MAARRASGRETADEVPSALVSVAVGAAALAAYLLLLSPVPAGRDGSEFVLVLAKRGLAHPTGYPLYTLAGHAFVRLLHACGASWAWSANAWSALGGAVAVGLLHALAARLLASSAGAGAASALALLPVLAFAAGPAWTGETTLAEVTSWHVAWVAGAALAALAVTRALGAREASPAAARRAAAAWGAVVALGLVHHTTSVLFSVPLTLALAVVARRAGRRPGPLAAAAAAGALPPLLALGWVGWRAFHPGPATWPALEPGLASIVRHVTGAQYRVYLGHFAPSPGERRLLAHEVYPWLAGALAGAVATLARRRSRQSPVRAALAVATLAQAAACFGYGVPDPVPYFLPPLAVGLALLAAALAASRPVRRTAWLALPVAALGLLAFARHGWSVATERRDALVRFDALLRDMWTRIPGEPAFVVWDDDMAQRLRAFQALEGLGTSLVVVQPRLLSYPAERARFARRHGFDPLAGLAAGPPPAPGPAGEARAAAYVEGVVEALRSRSTLPVYLFLPQVPSVRRLLRPGETAAAVHAP